MTRCSATTRCSHLHFYYFYFFFATFYRGLFVAWSTHSEVSASRLQPHRSLAMCSAASGAVLRVVQCSATDPQRNKPRPRGTVAPRLPHRHTQLIAIGRGRLIKCVAPPRPARLALPSAECNEAR